MNEPSASNYKSEIAACIAYACLNEGYARDAAQALSNSGLIDDRGTWEQGYAIGYEEGAASAVPPGLTAEKLRDLADGLDTATDHFWGDIPGELRAWADALSTPSYGGGRGE